MLCNVYLQCAGRRVAAALTSVQIQSASWASLSVSVSFSVCLCLSLSLSLSLSVCLSVSLSLFGYLGRGALATRDISFENSFHCSGPIRNPRAGSTANAEIKVHFLELSAFLCFLVPAAGYCGHRN